MPPKLVGSVVASCKNPNPGLPKFPCKSIQLIAGYGVEHYYHAGKFIRHRYLARKDPGCPNNRQVLVVDGKIMANIANKGIQLKPGQLGENILLTEVGLMHMPLGTTLQIGMAVIELTEIRHPCDQLNEIHPHLMETVMPEKNNPATYNAGMLGIIIKSGRVKTGDVVKLF